VANVALPLSTNPAFGEDARKKMKLEISVFTALS
jgi:hypothetical protein